MSEDFRTRLRRLRRESPAPSPAESPPDADPSVERSAQAPNPLPGWFRARAARVGRSEQSAAEAAAPPKSFELPADIIEVEGPRGRFGARTQHFALDHRHGDWALAEVEAVGALELALCARDTALAEVHPRDSIYLDIETSGLSGGAGVHPFLVGLGWFEAQEFVLWQGFVRDPSEEAAMLAQAAELVRSRTGLVSFFGKSFDRHRLEDKMRVFGIAPPFGGRPHLDLYHVCHRLYRAAFEDGRLATMETGLCGLVRPDDLPGSFAPAAWFDFLAGRPHRLNGVFQHNLDDVLSLVTLTAHLGRALDETRADGQPLGGPAATRAAGLGRVLGQNDPMAGLLWFDRAIERRSSAGSEPPPEWLFERADLARRGGAIECAMAGYRAYLAASSHSSSSPAARVREAQTRIAMLCEHHAKDSVRALGATLAALGSARRIGATARELKALERRRERLRAKLKGSAKGPARAPAE